jgi:hypothetical protein
VQSNKDVLHVFSVEVGLNSSVVEHKTENLCVNGSIPFSNRRLHQQPTSIGDFLRFKGRAKSTTKRDDEAGFPLCHKGALPAHDLCV